VVELAKSAIPTQGSRIVYDMQIPGFGLRVTAAGAVAFVLNYYFEGKERRYTVGRWPEWSADAARDEALDLRKEIKQGKDPLEERDRQELETARSERTVSTLAQDYLENYAETHKRPASVRDDRNMLRSAILPRLGTMELSAIKRRDVELLHKSLKGSPYKANRVLSLLSKMFSCAIASEWMTTNPAKGITRYLETPRKVWLSKEQLNALKKALDKYSAQDAANAIRLLLLTGARPGELLSAEWTAFDLKKGTWNKPSCATKQKKDESVPLNAPALALLKEMFAHKIGSPYLFPGQAEQRLCKSRKSLKWAWMQISKTAGLARELKIQGKHRELSRWKPIFRIYDLRHSFASHCVSNGESLYVVGKLLGHTQSRTTERYAHVADAATRKTTDHFAEIIGWSSAH
jgi:integrase